MFSYWEKESFLQYDHIVIGSGLVGLNTAVELKEQYPSQSVLVLERGIFPYGASTRNAGFACMGSLSELMDDLQQVSEAEMIALFTKRLNGLKQLRKRLGDSAIGYKENGSYEVISEKELPVLQHIDYINTLLQPVCGQNPFRMASEKLSLFGFSKTWGKELVEHSCEGELHTGKLMKSLIAYCFQLGIEIKTGTNITSFRQEDNEVKVFIEDPVRNEVIGLQGKYLFLCTNAFTQTLLPDAPVIPGRGQVLITEPIEGLSIKGIFHFDRGYYYFREIDNRILFGGGRQLDFEGETTTQIAIQSEIQADLEYKLQHLILPGKNVKIDMRWSGIMAFGSSRLPVVQQQGERIFAAYRMGGMGVALATLTAKEVVGLLMGDR